MAQRISGASLSVQFDKNKLHLTKSGTVDRRYKLSGTITNKNLRQIIQQEVARTIEDGTLDFNKSDNVKNTPRADINAKKKGRLWRTSIMGVSIAGRSLFSTGAHIAENIASTDSVALQRTAVNGAVSATTSIVGMTGPWGAVVATILSTAWYVFGNRVNNGIQRRGDKNRMSYNFENYDAYKYGTYCYDSSSGEWSADDATKVQNRVLGKKHSV